MKRVIILEAVAGSAQGYKYALWAAVPAARQPFYAKSSNYKSAWKDASVAENDALRAGQVVELVDHFNNPTALTLAQVKTQLEALWNTYQTFITNNNPWDRYGSFYDDTNNWTNGGVS